MSDKIKTLSQAIRLGATFREQCEDEYFFGGNSCALGGAYEAITGRYNDSPMHVSQVLDIRFGTSIIQKQVCSVCGEVFLSVGRFVSHLNDRHKWTREHIADHLESLGY